MGNHCRYQPKKGGVATLGASHQNTANHDNVIDGKGFINYS